MFIGVVISAILYGGTLAQTFYYYTGAGPMQDIWLLGTIKLTSKTAYRSDALYLKMLVSSIERSTVSIFNTIFTRCFLPLSLIPYTWHRLYKWVLHATSIFRFGRLIFSPVYYYLVTNYSYVFNIALTTLVFSNVSLEILKPWKNLHGNSLSISCYLCKPSTDTNFQDLGSKHPQIWVCMTCILMLDNHRYK